MDLKTLGEQMWCISDYIIIIRIYCCKSLVFMNLHLKINFLNMIKICYLTYAILFSFYTMYVWVTFYFYLTNCTIRCEPREGRDKQFFTSVSNLRNDWAAPLRIRQRHRQGFFIRLQKNRLHVFYMNFIYLFTYMFAPS